MSVGVDFRYASSSEFVAFQYMRIALKFFMSIAGITFVSFGLHLKKKKITRRVHLYHGETA